MSATATSLLDQVFRAVDKVGYQRTAQVLQQLEHESISYANSDVERVTNIIATGFEIPVHEIFFGVGRKNERRMAVGFSVYYLHTRFDYTLEQISGFLGKDFSQCHKYIRIVQNLNPKNIADEKYCQLKETFDLQIQKPVKECPPPPQPTLQLPATSPATRARPNKAKRKGSTR